MLQTCVHLTKKSNTETFGGIFMYFFPPWICSQRINKVGSEARKTISRITLKIIRIKIKSYAVTQNSVVIKFTGAENLLCELISPFGNLMSFSVSTNPYYLSIYFI